MQGSGPAATEKAILKEEASIVNGRGNCQKEKGIHSYCFLICHVRHGMGSHSLATWVAREEKNSFIFLSCPGLSQNIISGDPTGTSTFLVHFQEAGTKGSKLYRTGGKHNIFSKRRKILLLVWRQSLINDVDPWLNNIWERKLFHFGSSYNRWLEFWAPAKPPWTSIWLASYYIILHMTIIISCKQTGQMKEMKWIQWQHTQW